MEKTNEYYMCPKCHFLFKKEVEVIISIDDENDEVYYIEICKKCGSEVWEYQDDDLIPDGDYWINGNYIGI